MAIFWMLTWFAFSSEFLQGTKLFSHFVKSFHNPELQRLALHIPIRD